MKRTAYELWKIGKLTKNEAYKNRLIMKTRIIARYLIKEGFNKIGDREIDDDVYQTVEVKTVEQGHMLIAKNDLHGNGIGTIIEQKEVEYEWEDVLFHDVSEGVIYQTRQP